MSFRSLRQHRPMEREHCLADNSSEKRWNKINKWTVYLCYKHRWTRSRSLSSRIQFQQPTLVMPVQTLQSITQFQGYFNVSSIWAQPCSYCPQWHLVLALLRSHRGPGCAPTEFQHHQGGKSPLRPSSTTPNPVPKGTSRFLLNTPTAVTALWAAHPKTWPLWQGNFLLNL